MYLRRHEDLASHYPADMQADILDLPGEWSCMIDTGAEQLNTDGHFDELIARGISAGAEEFLVWDERSLGWVTSEKPPADPG